MKSGVTDRKKGLRNLDFLSLFTLESAVTPPPPSSHLLCEGGGGPACGLSREDKENSKSLLRTWKQILTRVAPRAAMNGAECSFI